MAIANLSIWERNEWCYVIGIASGCKDKKKSAFNDEVFAGLNEVFYSEDAYEDHNAMMRINSLEMKSFCPDLN